MKSPPHRNPEQLDRIGRPPNATGFHGERERHGNARRRSEIVPHRRYPSLSDDDQPPMFSVRVVALVALVAIVLALAYRS